VDGTSLPLRASAIANRAFAAVLIASALLPSPWTRVLAQTATDPGSLRLEGKIPLGPVRGRVDHLAYDPGRQHLFVAELGNDAVGVVDLKRREAVHTIHGLAEPQGIGYAASTDTIYVANARDGSVRLFRGSDYAGAGQIDLGSDADNVRLDTSMNQILVGYGTGALAVIDAAQSKKIREFPLPAHPEGFEISSELKQAFVNLPNEHGVAVVDSVTGMQKAFWRLRESGNFPMALDSVTGRVVIVSRNPPKLIVLGQRDGARIAEAETCSDSDDVFVDTKRSQVYVSCGGGMIDVFAAHGETYTRVARVPTIGGARTSVFAADLDLLLLGARASGGEGAAIWVYRALP
jgi:DNA-binding beta-propeller fold protein YncE